MRGAAFLYPEFTYNELPALRLGHYSCLAPDRYRSVEFAVFALVVESREDMMAVAR